MTLDELIRALRRRKVKLTTDGERLRYRSAKPLGDELQAAIKVHEAALLAIMRRPRDVEKEAPPPPADSPAADDQAGHLETVRRCLTQRLEALGLAGVQQLGRARPDAAADVPPGPADVAIGVAANPAASIPAAPDPGRPGAGEATATAAHAAEAPADPFEDGQADGQAEAPAAIPEAGQANGQTSGQADAQAASAGDLYSQRLWLRAVDELEGEFPPAVVERLRDATARWGGTKPPGPRSYDLRCRCGSTAWTLTVLLRPPHYGYAVRAVCGRCRKGLGLLWWEGGPGDLADDPPHHGELATRS
jgi:hypothetical protein